jgi:hypothetical protein
MRRGGIAAGLALVVGALITYRLFAPQPLARHPFVTLGRGVITDTSMVTVTGVALSSETLDYNGRKVAAGPGSRYVLLDCRFVASPDKVSFDDFQLVRNRAATLGQEENVGDHGDKDYFYWTYLEGSGKPTTAVPPSTNPFMARLAFKVPADAAQGFLFYWGLYWGPFVLR